MQENSEAPVPRDPRSTRKEQLLRELGEKLVLLGWQRPNTPELEAQIDGFRQQASEQQIAAMTKAIERRSRRTQVVRATDNRPIRNQSNASSNRF